jgi:adenosine kinase
MNIVITGSIAYDYIMHFPGHFTDHILPESLEKLTLSFHVHEMSRHWGGTGANYLHHPRV